ncbi:metallophosphoesterase [Hyphomicrobium methylovorum]|uniref:metallophosphoesterase family protein n=1 Tax=Hyphomicrobium methylovorum TaxID=84 RepID=UPI0015E791DD|nr:metallophosphoesterase [Hyphomicrobium methylovorum]MBA2127090.1 metallophosphoesterase [Hyphomicrobium methylovorum]
MTEPFTLAHFSDVHLPPAGGVPWRYANAKRLLGYLNWQRKRRHVHVRQVADRLIADARKLRPDHIAITGDLVNLGLPSEYEAALEWLESVGPPDAVTVVPGNHDIYSNLRGDRGIGRWAAYMGGEEETLAFPFIRRVGPLALIGLNSAHETPPFVARGALGSQQIEIASGQLSALERDGIIRVVLIHHPPLASLAAPRRELTDAAHFVNLIERQGAEVILYGHNHRARVDWLPTLGKPVPLVAAGSASALIPHNQEAPASYNLLTFFRKATGGLRIRLVVRGMTEANGPIEKLSETFLEFDQPKI